VPALCHALHLLLCAGDDDMAQPHWLPPPAAWLAHNRLLALGGLEPDELQDAFSSGRQKAKWPCNALIVASLHREGR
jgi:hypothetical protein